MNLQEVWLLPVWLMTLLAGLATFLLVRKAWRFRNLMILGAALPRAYICLIYLWTWIGNPTDATRVALLRWGIFILFATEALYYFLRALARRERDELDPG